MTVTPDLSICNEALARLGTFSSLTVVDDTTAEGKACGMFYEQTLNSLLTSPEAPGQQNYIWNWAKQTIRITPNKSLLPDWEYQVILPPDFVKGSQILETNSEDFVGDNIKRHDLVKKKPLYTVRNVPAVGGGYAKGLFFSRAFDLFYGVYLGEDSVAIQNRKFALEYISNSFTVDEYPITFRAAFAQALAFRLAVPLTGDFSLEDKMHQAMSTYVAQACYADQHHEDVKYDYIPEAVAGRMLGSGFCAFDNSVGADIFKMSNDASTQGAPVTPKQDVRTRAIGNTKMVIKPEWVQKVELENQYNTDGSNDTTSGIGTMRPGISPVGIMPRSHGPMNGKDWDDGLVMPSVEGEGYDVADDGLPKGEPRVTEETRGADGR